jgi:hypothetical protein
MALRDCPECGREISSTAVSCPGCGAPQNTNIFNSVCPYCGRSASLQERVDTPSGPRIRCSCGGQFPVPGLQAAQGSISAFTPVQGYPAASSTPSRASIRYEYGWYTGDWLINKPHGKGKIEPLGRNRYCRNGNIYSYEGDWYDGKPSGNGKIEYTNGNIYEGQCYDWLPSGKGKMTRPKGKCFLSRIFGKNGKIQEGNWSNGKLK